MLWLACRYGYSRAVLKQWGCTFRVVAPSIVHATMAGAKRKASGISDEDTIPDPLLLEERSPTLVVNEQGWCDPTEEANWWSWGNRALGWGGYPIIPFLHLWTLGAEGSTIARLMSANQGLRSQIVNL